MKKFSWRGLSIVIFICVSAFYLAPLAIPNLPEWWASKKLKLGLDLKGGMQILLEVDSSKLSTEDARNALDQNIKIIRYQSYPFFHRHLINHFLYLGYILVCIFSSYKVNIAVTILATNH